MDSAEDYLYLVSKLPKDIKEVVAKLKDGIIRHEINFSEDSFTNKAFRININRLAFVFILGLMMICSTLLMINMGEKQVIRIFFYITLAITTITALRLLSKTKFG
jgi:hypothetical protein